MNIENKNFITWLFHRLSNKHKEEISVIQNLSNFVSTNFIFSKNIDLSTTDAICKKFYPDFDIDRVPEINIGYTDKERNHMRTMIIEIIKTLDKQS